MKHLFISIVLSTITAITFAQDLDLEMFYMPQIQSKEDCAKYIGKRVCVFDYSSATNKRWEDSYKFEKHYWAFSHYEKIYTIKKIKFGEQIVFSLVSNSGSKYKIKVNNGGVLDEEELSSCNIFFLLDDFEEYKKEMIGKIYKNSQNEDVAVLNNIEIFPRLKDDPILVSTLKSLINNEEFICLSNDVIDFCKRLGTIISHPKVLDEYKILSGHTINLEEAKVDKRFKYIYAEGPWYTCKNLSTGKIFNYSGDKILTAPFETALSGKYISLLNKVEKPANHEIRYGETKTIMSDNEISKFSYKDNVIDIIIFADGSHFNFVLQNISESTIKIIWDEAVFVDFEGNSEKVMHKGTKFSERNDSQPATTIIRNAKWDDSVIPTNLVYYREATENKESGWDIISIYPEEKGLEPGQIKLMLPIQIKDVINEYVFIFDVKYIFNNPEYLKIDLPKQIVLTDSVN